MVGFMAKWDFLAKNKTSRQTIGEIDTYCLICKKKQTVKLLDISKKNLYGYNRTVKCDCGVAIYKYNIENEFHDKEYFTRGFISKKDYVKNYGYLDNFEKLGLKKKVLSGRVIYEK